MEKRNNIILVPIDFTQVADNAIAHAIGTAKFLQWKVTLLHIINKDTKALLKIDKATHENVELKMQEKVHEIEKEYGFSVDFFVREGSIFEEIGKLSKELAAEYVFMGTHGKHGIQYFTGSYAFKVITSSEVPFIVVQDKTFEKPYENIVLPLDDSLESRQKIKWAIYIAKRFKAKILIKAMYKTDDIQRYKLTIIMQRMIKILKDNNIEHEFEMKEGKGSFSNQTIEYAKQNNADLIIIMTNQDTNAFPSFMFSHADEKILFNEAQIPVMCVNPRDLNITIVGM
jgi:nucleotide-binding universal stress UspA family protein